MSREKKKKKKKRKENSRISSKEKRIPTFILFRDESLSNYNLKQISCFHLVWYLGIFIFYLAEFWLSQNVRQFVHLATTILLRAISSRRNVGICSREELFTFGAEQSRQKLNDACNYNIKLNAISHRGSTSRCSFVQNDSTAFYSTFKDSKFLYYSTVIY